MQGADNPISHELTFMMALMEYEELQASPENEARRKELVAEMEVRSVDC